MDKHRDSGSTRFSTPMQLPGEMNKLSHSIGTNSTINSVNFPKKFLNHDHPYLINHVPAPTKPRSGITYTATKKRPHESLKICDPMLPESRIGLKDCTKKQKASAEEFKDYVMTKEEEDAAQALFALAQTLTHTDANITSEVEPSSLQLMRDGSMRMEPSNADQDTKANNGKSLQKRGPVHIYICRFIKDIQTSEIEGLGLDDGSKLGAHVNVASDTNSQKITNGYDLMGLHLANPQYQYYGNLSTPTVEQELSYFNIDHDHSKRFKRQYSRNRITSTGSYHY